MFQLATRRAIGLSLLLTASIVFQTVPMVGTGVAFARSRKDASSKRQPQPPSESTAPQPLVTTNGSLPLPAAPNITATKVDAWDDSATPDGKAEPGQTITYTVTISNTGSADATGVVFTDSVDTNTTLIGGSIDVQPIALPDTYNVIGNVRIQPNAAQGLLANDTTFGGTVSGPSTSTQGGNVSINPDGSFSYNPPVGFAGTDTFTYTVTSTGGKTDTAIATFNVGNGTATPGTNVVWFVDPAAAPGGDGRLTSPFNCYTGGTASCFSQTAADDPGDTIFLYSGAHIGGYTLLNNQKLVGQGASATLAGIGGFTVQAYSDALPVTNGTPSGVTITTTNVNAIPLPTGAGNTPLLRGFTVGNVGTGTKITGTTFGTLTVGDNTTPDVILNGTGQALNLATGTFAATSAFSSVTTTSSGAQGILLTQISGTVALGPTTVSGSTSNGIDIQNLAAGASVAFGNTSVTKSSPGSLVNLANNAGNVSFLSLGGTNTNGAGLVGTENTGTITVSNNTGSLTTTLGPALNITKAAAPATPISLNFGTLSSTDSGTQGVNINRVSGNLTVTTTTSTNPTGIGISVTNTSAGGTMNFGNTTSNTSGGTGVSLGTNAGAVSFNALNIAPDASVAGFSLASSTGNTSSSSGTISTTDAPAVTVTSAGVNMTLTSVSADNTGDPDNCVNLTSATGTLTMQGGTLTGGSSAAFFISGGTVTATYSGGITQATAGQPMVSVSGHQTGTITFQTGTLSATNGTGLVFDNADGTYNFNGTTTLNGGNAHVQITNGSGGSFTFGSGTSITNPSTAAAFDVSGGAASAPNVTYGGTLTQNTAGQRAINISAINGGTESFSGAIGSNGGAGVSIEGTGGTVNISGNMTLNNTASVFKACSGTCAAPSGTGLHITATGTNNTVGATNAATGPGITINRAQIDASGVAFKSVSTTGGTNGIVLSNTGASGAFTVAGGGNTSQGGDFSGGTIQNTTGAGILLTTTQSPSFNNMRIMNTPNGPGVDGTDVTNFTFTNGTISASGLTSHSAFDSSIAFNDNGTTINNVDGTVTITNNVFSTPYQMGVDILNNSGTLADVNVSNNAITSDTAAANSAGSGIRVQALGSASGAATITKGELNGNTIVNFPNGAGIVVQGGNVTSLAAPSGNFGTNTTTGVFQINNNVMHGQSTANPFGTNCLLVTMPGKGTGFIEANGNTLSLNKGNCLSINSTGAYNLTATANNNTVTPGAGQLSGSFGMSGGADKQVLADLSTADSAVLNLTATGNNVSSTTGVGIYYLANSTATLNAKIQNNTVAAPTDAGVARPAIRVDSGTSAGTAVDTKVCVQVTGNTATGSSNGAFQFDGIAFRKEGNVSTTNDFGIVGLSPNPSNDTQMQTYLRGQNPADVPGGGGGGAVINSHGGSQVWTSCTLSFLQAAPGGVESNLTSANSLFFGDPGSLFTDRAIRLDSPAYTIAASLNQAQLDSVVLAAMDRWANSGLTAQQVAHMRELKFETADLSADYLGEAKDNTILVDRSGRGKGWFVDATPYDDAEFGNVTSTTRRYTDPYNAPAGHVDLLTAIEHEIGHKLGLPDSYAKKDCDSIMYGYLTVGERRVPRLGEAKGAKPETLSGVHFLKLDQTSDIRGQKSEVRHQTSDIRGQKSEVRLNHAKTTRTLTPVFGAGGTVTANIGTLAPGDSVTITFQVTIDNPYSGGPNVSNQGTVSGSNFSNVLTDDPAVGGAADPTLTPINVAPDVTISNAKVAEPTSGTTPMLFTVALSAPASGTITVTYNTADGSAVAPGDYVSAVNQTVTFAAGEQLKIIPITVNSDVDGSEGDENFTVTISVPPGQGNVVGATGTGTITAANPAGTLLISELRTSGPGGSADEFVEIYNNTDTPHVVAATNGSTGYGVFKMGAGCNATPILVGTIPNGTTIPARGHYLLVGSAYGLANYGGSGAAAGNLTMTSDIENDRNVSIFSTTNVLALSTTTRFDAVGFGTNTGNVCDLQREGTNLGNLLGSTLQYSFFRTMTKTSNGNPKDTNDNAADFLFADTAGTFVAGAGQHLGAPGPENLASPIRRDTSGILLPLLDGTVSSASAPNRFRDLTPAPPTASQGTMEVRRRVQNTTGATVTRLRFRIVDITTFPSPGAGTADLRVLTSSAVVISGINDPATCASTGTPVTVPCQVTAQVTTLETPPAQANGGGYNSTVTVTLPGPGLANNASIDVNFKLGVVTSGSFRFLIIVEALP